MPQYTVKMELESDPPAMSSEAQKAFAARFPEHMREAWKSIPRTATDDTHLKAILHQIIESDCYAALVNDFGVSHGTDLDISGLGQWVPSGGTHEGMGIVKDGANRWRYFSDGMTNFHMKVVAKYPI